jgi:hypothetical protein
MIATCHSNDTLEIIITLCGLAFVPIVILGTSFIEDMKERKEKREKRTNNQDIKKSKKLY